MNECVRLWLQKLDVELEFCFLLKTYVKYTNFGFTSLCKLTDLTNTLPELFKLIYYITLNC